MSVINFLYSIFPMLAFILGYKLGYTAKNDRPPPKMFNFPKVDISKKEKTADEKLEDLKKNEFYS